MPRGGRCQTSIYEWVQLQPTAAKLVTAGFTDPMTALSLPREGMGLGPGTHEENLGRRLSTVNLRRQF